MFIFYFFIIWRGFLTLFALVAKRFVIQKPDFLGPSVWANFDGVHYLSIAQYGYRQFQQAFFPLYPLLIRWLTVLTKNYLFSGLLISHLSFVTALFLFYKLIKLDFTEKTARRSLFYLLLFPTSFYFGSVYTESLFLVLVLGSFYAARKKYWLVAGVLGAMASATRVVGLFLFPALLAEWWQQWREIKSGKIVSLLSLLLITSGILVYMSYLKKTVGDALYFIHVQPFFGAHRSGSKIILLYQVFWRYLKMILTTKADVLYFSVWLELIVSLLFLFLLIEVYRRLRRSYFIFMLFCYLAPTLTGTFSSMPRYVLVLFPGFILLALLAEKYRWLRIVYPIVAVILSIASAILFTRGYWVA